MAGENTLGKVEACIKLSNGKPQVFKRMIKKVTGMSGAEFDSWNLTSVAHEMMVRGESVEAIENAVL